MEDQVRLVVKSAIATALFATHLRASHLTHHSGSTLLYCRVQERTRQVLALYNILVWYLASRVMYVDARPLRAVARLALRLARPSYVMAGFVVTGHIVDEAIYAMLVALFDDQQQELHSTLAPVVPGQECSICLEGSSEFGPLRRFCPASPLHLNHSECIHLWFRSDNAKARECPICRHALVSRSSPFWSRLRAFLTNARFYGRIPLRALVSVASGMASFLLVWFVISVSRSGP